MEEDQLEVGGGVGELGAEDVDAPLVVVRRDHVRLRRDLLQVSLLLQLVAVRRPVELELHEVDLHLLVRH